MSFFVRASKPVAAMARVGGQTQLRAFTVSSTAALKESNKGTSHYLHSTTTSTSPHQLLPIYSLIPHTHPHMSFELELTNTQIHQTRAPSTRSTSKTASRSRRTARATGSRSWRATARRASMPIARTRPWSSCRRRQRILPRMRGSECAIHDEEPMAVGYGALRFIATL